MPRAPARNLHIRPPRCSRCSGKAASVSLGWWLAMLPAKVLHGILLTTLLPSAGPTLRRALLWWSSTAALHLFHVRPISSRHRQSTALPTTAFLRGTPCSLKDNLLDVLRQIADVASHFMPWLEREGNDRLQHTSSQHESRRNFCMNVATTATYHEAEGEPLPSMSWHVSVRSSTCATTARGYIPPFVHSPREVSAVLALAGDVLVALESRGEGVSPAHEDKRHNDSL